MPHRIYTPPRALDDERRVCATIDLLRAELGHLDAEPRRWMGGLRRMTQARASQGSNSIEGYAASLDDVLAVQEGEEPLEASRETTLALAGYRDAMTYVLQLAQDTTRPAVDEGLLRSLHFMMHKHDLAKHPGRWRPSAVLVRRDPEGEVVYEGAPSDDVPALVRHMLDQLDRDDTPALVRAAMAHLNLVMIHPFRDGNGRMGRALQTLVLARDQVVAPVFSSIEEYLGRNTEAYYAMLARVGQGAWHPGNDARPWVRFCLTAHYRQAHTLLWRVEGTERLWRGCDAIATRHGLPERVIGPLSDAAQGLRIRRAGYIRSVGASAGEEISAQTATRDLVALVRAGLLAAHGERRARVYSASEGLGRVWRGIRASRPSRADDDPFAPPVAQLELI